MVKVGESEIGDVCANNERVETTTKGNVMMIWKEFVEISFLLSLEQ